MDKKYWKTLINIVDIIDKSCKIIGLKNKEDKFIICTDIYDAEIQPKLEKICSKNELDFDYSTIQIQKKKQKDNSPIVEVPAVQYIFFVKGDIV